MPPSPVDAVPPGEPLPSGWNSFKEEVVDVRFPLGTSNASRRLSESIIRRTITGAQQVTQLIQQKGADLNVEPLLRVAGTTGRYQAYPLVALCIDNLTDNSLPSIWAGDGGDSSPVAMPTWETPGLQLAVMWALIQRGADINGGSHLSRPIRVALAWCNRAAFDLLMGHPGAHPFTALTTRNTHHDICLFACLSVCLPVPGIQLRGREAAMQVRTLPTDQPTEAHEAILLSFYRQLIQRDTTLATERDFGGLNLVHRAALRDPVWSQHFIESYIDLLVTNGADITAVDTFGGRTPLHCTALFGSHRVAASLCRRLAAADINRGTLFGNERPLTVAAERLDEDIQQLQDDTTEQAVRDRATIRIPHLKTTIRVLLQAGADIALMPTATENDRGGRQLVLPEYATVLNNLPDAVMATINAALAPQRSLAALLAPLLAVGPQEAPIFAWRLASYLFDMEAAIQTITDKLPFRHSAMARRVRAAVEYFIRSAVHEASSNREVVGGMADVGGVTVRVPLQCFAVRGSGGQVVMTGVREVVHKARLDEAARYDLVGVVKGFNEHLGNDDCQLSWQQLGRIDERGQCVSLGID